ncbi:hypothetical protein K458DRAFT_394060 [Lentithecium fluviatile CBS 122367]|uniref:DUF7918 domain-containing protein n=1 Tax=Lentithecium fluviatile CBS 122367 TaxID=1168545 RepID=A0A6G1IMJ2_9PLEO|nr:hypothetical protein K458DRAFT_394060 [Lentithecium fluviatile CBS 122367]
MPSLKDLDCFIELPGTNNKLQEFGTSYNDGCVEAFVAVPSDSQPFAIRLSSSQFIASGLAMYVFIDGIYQCNRNRQDLRLRKPPDRKTLVNLCVRQKEEMQKDGTLIARDWRFEKLNIDDANNASENCSSNVMENIGCIEVVVLRCAGPRRAKPGSKSKAKNINMDGAGDESDDPFGMDGGWDKFGGAGYGERDWNQTRGTPIAGYGTPVHPAASHAGPPPPVSPQSYIGHTTRSARRPTAAPSPYSHSSSDARAGNRPIQFQYGSGQIQHRSRAGSATGAALSATRGTTQAFDPNMLDQLLAKALEKGVAEAHRQGGSLLGQSVAPSHISQEPPGAWPSPPFGHTTQPSPSIPDAAGMPAGNASMVSGILTTNWGGETAPPKAGTQISWGQPARTAAPSAAPNASGFGAPGINDDSWDSGDTWGSKPKHGGGRGSTHRSGHSETHSAWETAASRAKSPTIRSTRSRGRQSPHSRHSAKSRPRASVWESKTDKDGWTHVETQSDTDSSSSSSPTVRPPSSVSVAATQASAPPSSAVSQNAGAEKASVWEEPPIVLPPVPPGLDYEGAPGPFAILPDIFKKSAKVDIWSLAGMGDDSGGRHASRDNADNHAWGSGNEADTRTAKTIATVDEGQGSSASWNNTNDSDKQKEPDAVPNNDAAWATFSAATKSPDPNPWPSAPSPATPKPKSRLSKYRQNRPPTLPLNPHNSTFAAADPNPKPYWSFPPSPPPPNPHPVPPGATVPPCPIYTFPKTVAEEKGVEHQVRPGEGTKYLHYIGRPEYVDSFDRPYAVFRFKYRSREALGRLLGVRVPERPVEAVASAPAFDIPFPSAGISTKATKEQLKKLPQDTLIEGLLDLQSKLSEREKDKHGTKWGGGTGWDGGGDGFDVPCPSVVKYNADKSTQSMKELIEQLPQNTLVEGLMDLQFKLSEKDRSKDKNKHSAKPGGGSGWGACDGVGDDPDKDKDKAKDEDEDKSSVCERMDRKGDGGTDIVGMDRTEDWVRMHSSRPSAKGVDVRSGKSKTRSGRVESERKSRRGKEKEKSERKARSAKEKSERKRRSAKPDMSQKDEEKDEGWGGSAWGVAGEEKKADEGGREAGNEAAAENGDAWSGWPSGAGSVKGDVKWD